jgi:MSHA biogenesis protein MshJ
LQPRERLTLFIGIVVVILGVFYMLVLDPATQRYSQSSKTVQQNDKMLTALREQQLALTQQTAVMPDTLAAQQIAKARADNKALRERLYSSNMPLVSPDRMRTVLSDLISAQKGLTLMSVRSLPAEDLLADSSAGANAVPHPAGGQSLYRQGLELTLQGGYRELAEYVRQVEALPLKVQLDSVTLRSEQYPVTTLKIVLHTLSLERPWIGL